MFWKLVGLMVIAYAVAMYFSFTLGGFVHILPVAALVMVVVRRMGKNPDSEFGRWESTAQRARRK
jgi:hypothetical protein